MKKRIYEVELLGFDGTTDATDHLIKWYRAFSLSDVRGYLLINKIAYNKITLTDLTEVDATDIDKDLSEG